LAAFDELSDYDFEILVADLLGAELSKRFETFPRGRDGGVDLRAGPRRKLHVVQCKHYQHSSFAQLKRAAKGEPKHFKSHPPAQYTFVTSRRLTSANKAALLDVLAPLADDEQQILGRDDVEALLRAHPKVERGHVKLWLRSVAPLDRIVNADVHARSAALLNDINVALPRYVQTKSFSEARTLLAEHNIVIVAGPPGIGKTTLARLLLLDCAEAGYVPYSIQTDVGEGWRRLKDDEPQVFFFDDFLGRTALFEGVRNDTRDLASFMRRVRERPASRLILATREYVLRQAEQQVEELKWQRLEADRYALTLEKYTRLERAHIFYNHVYFSPHVNETARKSLRHKRIYLRVIDHPAYSPRLIEWMTGLGGQTLTEAELENFGEFCVGTLDNPEDLWAHAYAQGLKDRERCLLTQLCGLPRNVSLADLETAYKAAAKERRLPSGKASFEQAIKVLQDSFLHVARIAENDFVSVLNPSLIDFLKQQLIETPGALELAVRGAAFFDQVDFYCQVARENETWSQEWNALFASAVSRTIGAEYDDVAFIRPPGDRHNDEFPTAGEARLARIGWWCQREQTIDDNVRNATSAAAKELLEDVAEDTPARITTWPRLLSILQSGGIEIADLADLAKSLAERRVESDPLEGYETLAEMRRVVRGAFSDYEWLELQEQFETWADEALGEATEWFDDEDSFAQFEIAATRLGVALSDETLDDARLAIQEMLAEQQEQALEDVDREGWEQERDDDVIRVVDDTPEIDAMFGMLSD
jgi:Restriction endonuclease